MRPQPKSPRGAALEGILFRINEGPPAVRVPPFRLTYVGEGVYRHPDLGNFQSGTTAAVERDEARRFAGDPAWRVTTADGRAVEPGALDADAP